MENQLQRVGYRSIGFVLLACAMRASLDFAYVHALSPVYGYQGFYIDFSIDRYAYSWIFFLITLINVPSTFYRLSGFFIIAAVLAYMGPLTSMYGLRGGDFFPILVAWAGFQAVYLIAKSPFVPVPHFPDIKYGERIAVSVSAFALITVLAWLLLSGAGQNFNLNLEDVYAFREAASSVADDGIMAYISTWAYKTFSVFLICWSLYRRNYALTIALIALQVVFFGLTSHKSVLFTPLAIVLIWWFLRRGTSFLFLPAGFTFLILFAVLMTDLGDIGFLSFFVRRVLFLPSLIHMHYFEFFSDNPTIWWTHLPGLSALGHPYDGIPPADIIGDRYFEGSHSNIGFLAAGYAQGRMVGVVLYVLLVGFLLRLFDSLQSNVSELWFFVALTVFHIGLLLTTMDPLTAMITHGLLPLYILLIASRKMGFANR